MNTNCVNCGAALEIDQLRQIKHCPYCGAEVEIKDETPDTMAGTIHGIAKTFFNQTADKIRYNREHAVEIAEQRRKDKAEEARQSRKMMMYMMGGKKNHEKFFCAHCHLLFSCVSISARRKTPGRKKDNDLQSRL